MFFKKKHTHWCLWVSFKLVVVIVVGHEMAIICHPHHSPNHKLKAINKVLDSQRIIPSFTL